MEDIPAVVADTPAEVPETVSVPAPVVPQEEPVPEPQETPVSVRKELSIFFNDQPFFLPGKESGEPYFLMDLLEYSGIDFKNLDRRVRMEVNGEECGFQTALRQGDNVLICKE